MRHLIAAAFGGMRACNVDSETAILCGALGQKAYLGLEMAELAFQTWNIVGLAIASRTLVEAAAMVSALAADPKQASEILANQTKTGMSHFDSLRKRNPTIIGDSWALAMSLAHPSSKAYSLMVAPSDFTSRTDTKLLGYGDNESAAALQRLSCDAGMSIFKDIVSITSSEPNDEFSAAIDKSRREASHPSNLEDNIKAGIDSLNQKMLSLLSSCQSMNTNELKSTPGRVRLFGLQYSVHCIAGAAISLNFANPDAFVAICRSLMEAGAVVRTFAKSEASVATFLHKKKITWASGNILGALSDRVPDIVKWYKEAGAYPHASFLSLRPRLLINQTEHRIFSILSPTWDQERLSVWLPRAQELATAAENGWA